MAGFRLGSASRSGCETSPLLRQCASFVPRHRFDIVTTSSEQTIKIWNYLYRLVPVPPGNGSATSSRRITVMRQAAAAVLTAHGHERARIGHVRGVVRCRGLGEIKSDA